jgi:SAM-dependent methyltransferase
MANLSNENVSAQCPICGSASDATLRIVRGFRIAECTTCRFVFVNPRPALDNLVALYAGAKTNPFFSEAFENTASELPALKTVLRKIRRYVPTGRLLEVGCGRGDFLMLARTAGFSVTGCDFFGAHNRPDGIASFDGTLSQAQLTNNSFDIVVIRNVLEHVFDPNVELNEIRRILKSGAYLYVKVPNVAFEHGLGCRLVFGREHDFDPPFHLNHFSSASLIALLQKAGFQFVSWSLERPTLYPLGLRHLVRQSGYKLIEAAFFLTHGRAFPRIVLSCVARKNC